MPVFLETLAFGATISIPETIENAPLHPLQSGKVAGAFFVQ